MNTTISLRKRNSEQSVQGCSLPCSLKLPVGIAGIGSFVPAQRIHNTDLAKIVDTSDEWILQHTGIQERRYATSDMSTSDLAVEAAKSALQSAHMRPDQVDLIILATSSPNWVQPATACAVQEQLGITTIPAFDISAVCSGFVYALTIGASMLQSIPEYRSALIIGAEAYSKILDFEDRTSCIYFGDGAGAVVLSAVPCSYGILSTYLRTEGHLHDLVKVPAGGSHLVTSSDTLLRRQHYFRMDGRKVWQFVMQVVPEIIEAVLAKASLTLDKIDHFIFHQANRVMIEACLKKLGVESKRVHFTVERYGNTAAASIPITLCEAVTEGHIQQGDRVLCVAIGGGMTAASAIIRWY